MKLYVICVVKETRNILCFYVIGAIMANINNAWGHKQVNRVLIFVRIVNFKFFNQIYLL